MTFGGSQYPTFNLTSIYFFITVTLSAWRLDISSLGMANFGVWSSSPMFHSLWWRHVLIYGLIWLFSWSSILLHATPSPPSCKLLLQNVDDGACNMLGLWQHHRSQLTPIRQLFLEYVSTQPQHVQRLLLDNDFGHSMFPFGLISCLTLASLLTQGSPFSHSMNIFAAVIISARRWYGTSIPMIETLQCDKKTPLPPHQRKWKLIGAPIQRETWYVMILTVKL